MCPQKMFLSDKGAYLSKGHFSLDTWYTATYMTYAATKKHHMLIR